MGKVWYNVSITTHTEGTIDILICSHEKDPSPVFDSVAASYSYDVREGDTSAQWWETTGIYSTTENGESKIGSSSSTYWN